MQNWLPKKMGSTGMWGWLTHPHKCVLVLSISGIKTSVPTGQTSLVPGGSGRSRWGRHWYFVPRITSALFLSHLMQWSCNQGHTTRLEAGLIRKQGTIFLSCISAFLRPDGAGCSFTLQNWDYKLRAAILSGGTDPLLVAYRVTSPMWTGMDRGGGTCQTGSAACNQDQHSSQT